MASGLAIVKARSVVPDVDVVVVGGGMSGLAAADALTDEGLTVHLIEGAPGVGGLCRSVSVGGEDVEAYYHHIFPQDRELRELVDRLGMSGALEWRQAPMGVLEAGRVYPFNSLINLLNFKPLPFVGRLRLGLGSAMALLSVRGHPLDRVRVGEASSRWFGRKGHAVLWQPLLDGKFGPFAPDVAAPWLVSRIRQRANARKSGTGDRLGYLRGGMGTLARAYERELVGRGVRISCGARVSSLRREGESWRLTYGGREVSGRAVVACLSGEVLAGLCPLPTAYLESTPTPTRRRW
ncbi:MAG TPA: FAD-dependent oxidoreductase [Candidatus Limnocylindrales bacterium]|nr:FAD-dependent oxidoreductase [Candidatus Limnocylindrales bacterium]